LSKILNFIKYGATIIDLGARSTAPWSKSITIEEEKSRIQKALEIIPKIIPDGVIISIDTQYSEIAEFAIMFGKENDLKIIINDISAIRVKTCWTDKDGINRFVDEDGYRTR